MMRRLIFSRTPTAERPTAGGRPDDWWHLYHDGAARIDRLLQASIHRQCGFERRPKQTSRQLAGPGRLLEGRAEEREQAIHNRRRRAGVPLLGTYAFPKTASRSVKSWELGGHPGPKNLWVFDAAIGCSSYEIELVRPCAPVTVEASPCGHTAANAAVRRRPSR